MVAMLDYNQYSYVYKYRVVFGSYSRYGELLCCLRMRQSRRQRQGQGFFFASLQSSLTRAAKPKNCVKNNGQVGLLQLVGKISSQQTSITLEFVLIILQVVNLQDCMILQIQIWLLP